MKIRGKIKEFLTGRTTVELTPELLSCTSFFSGMLETDLKSKYTLGKEVGSGGFGTVRVATHKDTGAQFAVKTVKKSRLASAEDLKAFYTEAEIHLHLSGHPNIVGIVDLFEDDSSIYIVEEYCAGGTLLDKLAKRKRNFTEPEVAHIAYTVLGLLQYMHHSAICYRDLKLENFLYSSQGEDAVLKATDFGLSCFLTPGKTLNEPVGTLNYMAPEVLHSEYDFKADIYSLGVVLYCIASACFPYDNENEEQLARMILSKEANFSSGAWAYASPECKSFIKSMMAKNPRNRPNIDELLKHDFLKELKTPNKQGMVRPVYQRIKAFAALNKFKQEVYRVMLQGIDPQMVDGFKQIFCMWDKDNDGVVAIEEVADMLSARFSEVKKDELVAVFKQVVKPGSDQLTLQDYQCALINKDVFQNTARPVAAFHHFDAEGTGYITAACIAAVLNCDEADPAVVQALREADSDQDGKINVDEFVVWMIGRAGHNLNRSTSKDLQHQNSGSAGLGSQVAQATERVGRGLKKNLIKPVKWIRFGGNKALDVAGAAAGAALKTLHIGTPSGAGTPSGTGPSSDVGN